MITMKKPPLLRANDRVAVLATAGGLESPKLIAYGLQVLEQWGLQVELMPSATAKHGYFAGSDDLRRKCLQEALDREDIKAIFCSRGGYGTSKLLDQLDYRKFMQSPKWVTGYSDLTALHLKINQLGIMSLHCPTLNSFPKGEALPYMRQALFSPTLSPLFAEGRQCRIGEAIAPVVGGNLSMIAHSLGSSSEIDAKGKLLFLEEIGEHPYQIDRNLTQLQRAGIFEDAVGILLGDMDTDEEALNAFGMSLEEMILEKAPSGIPVAQHFPFGHIEENHAVLSGSTAHFSVESNHASLNFIHAT